MRHYIFGRQPATRRLASAINLFYFYRAVLKFRFWNSGRRRRRSVGRRKKIEGTAGRSGMSAARAREDRAPTIERELGRTHAGIKNIYVHYVLPRP